ncbi:MAG: hypothetical protein SAJ37_04925 [Oscillatoria sp. PMC 1068.18]|nr:hypothetical protein [Oscillatoria sp. PMC 1076.18]MEC4988072.1 hypothetical protein [Oscillatoria sp. PMC 1068.18]
MEKSRISEIEAIATSSEALFTTEQKLDSLIAAIKAKRKLQQLGSANPELENRVQLLLEQAVYGASEFNRFSGHQGSLYRLAISPDSQTIASSAGDNTVKLWARDGTLQVLMVRLNFGLPMSQLTTSHSLYKFLRVTNLVRMRLVSVSFAKRSPKELVRLSSPVAPIPSSNFGAEMVKSWKVLAEMGMEFGISISVRTARLLLRWV